MGVAYRPPFAGRAMLTILVIVLIILALGGFGHSGYRRGWYGNGYYDGPRSGWGGGGLGIVLLIIVLLLLFARHRY